MQRGIICSMALFHLKSEAIERLPETSFAELGVYERSDLQRLLKANVSVIAPEVLVISEEFSEWEDSKRRIDLLAIDTDATLVVIELKRDNDSHMELQAIRYAAMVSSMTFSRAVEVFQAHLDKTSPGHDARTELLEFLEWETAHEDDFAQDVRIILVAADFQKELTHSVLWLNDRQLDIRCVRMKPYRMGAAAVLDVQQVLPLPEAQAYTVKLREKAIERREAARLDTGYWFMNTGEGSSSSRSWDDCRKYGFMLAGGTPKHIGFARQLRVGDKVFAYLSGRGYVGLGEVTAEAVPFNDFVPEGHSKPLPELPLAVTIDEGRMAHADRCDWCARIRWIHAVGREHAVLKERARRKTLDRIKQPDLVADLRAQLGGLT